MQAGGFFKIVQKPLRIPSFIKNNNKLREKIEKFRSFRNNFEIFFLHHEILGAWKYIFPRADPKKSILMSALKNKKKKDQERKTK